MNSALLDKLKQFVEEEPNDPFNWYALALEYLKSDRAQALNIFTQLIARHPDYLPSYYQAGVLYSEQNQPEDAKTIFKKGIAIAKAQQEAKTAMELQQALQALIDYEE